MYDEIRPNVPSSYDMFMEKNLRFVWQNQFRQKRDERFPTLVPSGELTIVFFRGVFRYFSRVGHCNLL